ncbi:MAG: polysaccharide deacetylase family protein [Solirubrobacterales bacterium]|nr:polysaccharide deacetylase family protein [Solirubrobacterales bacterium]
MSQPDDRSETRLRVSSEAVHQRRRRAAGAGALALAAFVVWGIASLGGGSSSSAPADAFASRIQAIGGIGSGSLLAKVTKVDEAAIDSVLVTTPYIVKGGGEKKAVALTFDDGPSEYTPRVLAILRNQGVSGTFFSLGGLISTFGPNSVSARDAGNVIADHTWSHPQLPTLSIGEQQSEINRTSAAITALGLDAPRLFRPPYGAYDQATLAAAKKKKMLLVLWDVDSLDWSRPGVDAIVNNVLSQVQSGSIILMHDGGGPREQTLAALPRIIEGLRTRGYSMVTVPRLLAEDPPRAGETPPPVGAGA